MRLMRLFCSLDMMASGFNNFDPGMARQYAGAEAGDSFALLSSMEVMRPTGNLGSTRMTDTNYDAFRNNLIARDLIFPDAGLVRCRENE